jgi:predicted dienelactone hydrolase
MSKWLLIGALFGSWFARDAVADEYDPLKVESITSVRSIDLSVIDVARDREIPIRVYLPPENAGRSRLAAWPVVLFSHGLCGSRAGSPFLGKHWAARGYVAVFLQHPGSDESVWKDQPLAKRMAAMREAASGKNYLRRAQDVPAVLDQLAKWNGETGHELAERLDARNVGMSGHSFGGHTTQAVAGQKFPLGGQGLTDARVKAAIVMSPSAPDRGDINAAFGSVKIPWLLMTGTHDTAAIGSQTPESRRRVFPALAPGDKFELVLDKGEHSAFTERPLPGDREQRNPNHYRAILALSTAFWDAYLREEVAAKAWLLGDGPRRILEPADLWQKK